MSFDEKIRNAFERNAKAMRLRPSVGQGTAVTRVRVREGLTCEVEEGPWNFTVDMAEKAGGGNAGPNPGVYGRGALGSCLAITYKIWAANLQVPISSLVVEVHADYDSRGAHGVAAAPPGYKEVRYVVKAESEASETEIREMLDTADAHCPYLDVFARAQPMRREVQLAAPTR